MMDTSKNFMSWFDRFMTVGLGCAFVALCLLACAFIYTFQNPLLPAPSPTPEASDVVSTMTPVSIIETPAILSTGVLPTFTPILDDLIPTAIPNLGSDVPLNGRIVFTCFIGGFDEVCLMDADGSRRRQLTDFGSTSFYASLSPDGDQIYFSSRKDGGYEIYSMNPSGRGVRRLTFNIGALYAPELSPDGDRIIFTNEGNGIWTMRADGNNPHAISFRDDIDPTWSRDGDRIAFASSRTGTRQLYVMDKSGANVEQLTNLDNMGGRSSWSPNGQYIAFYRGPTGDHNIYIVNVETKEITRLTNGGDNLGPSWSPDGEWIAFTSFRDGNNEIYVMRPDGTSAYNLTNNPISDWQPRWGR